MEEMDLEEMDLEEMDVEEMDLTIELLLFLAIECLKKKSTQVTSSHIQSRS